MTTSIIILAIYVTATFTEGYKILMIPPDHHSNANFFAVAGATLKRAGHEVHYLSTAKQKKNGERNGLTPIVFNPVNYTNPTEDDSLMMKIMEEGFSFYKIMKLSGSISYLFADLCHEMLQDETIKKRLTEENYDLAIVETMDFVRCLTVIPYRHNIKFVSLSVRHDPWTARVSSSPATENQMGFVTFEDPNNPTFFERLKGLMIELVMYAMTPPPSMSPEFITKYAPNRPAIGMRELHQLSELYFINIEMHCLDSPRVSAPHYIFLGGIGNEPSKPLQGEFKYIAESAKDGLVVVTFGSAVKRIPINRMVELMGAFKQVTQTVVMRYDGEMPPEIPSNVKFSKWLPQNDLLGHPNTKLFITHGGANGQMEALNHGVPFISIPLTGDQIYNALRAEKKKLGKSLQFHTFTSAELLKAIRELTENPEYKERISKCSARFKALPDPRNVLTFWVEHVIKFGGDHLKPAATNYPFWKFMNWDISLLFFALLYSLVYLLKLIFRKLFSCCKRKTKTD